MIREYEIRQAVVVLEAIMKRAQGKEASFVGKVLKAAFDEGKRILEEEGFEIEATRGGISWRRKARVSA